MNWRWHEWLLLIVVAILFFCVIIFVDCGGPQEIQCRGLEWDRPFECSDASSEAR